MSIPPGAALAKTVTSVSICPLRLYLRADKESRVQKKKMSTNVIDRLLGGRSGLCAGCPAL